MKKIGKWILILLIFIFAFNAYRYYKKNNPPENIFIKYVKSEIDLNYYKSKDLVLFTNVRHQLNAKAKKIWHNYLEDVHSEKYTDIDFLEDQLEYKELKEVYLSIDRKLKESKKQKQLGRTNKDIQFIEDNIQDMSSDLKEDKNKIIIFEYGMVGETILEIQQKLNKLNCKLPSDGIFLSETEEAVRYFQKQNNLKETGKVDLKTLLLILK